MKIIILKGNEVAAAANVGSSSTISNSRIVKFYHTAAAVVTLVDTDDIQIGNTSVEAGTHYFSKNPSDKVFASAGLFTPVGFGD